MRAAAAAAGTKAAQPATWLATPLGSLAHRPGPRPRADAIADRIQFQKDHAKRDHKPKFDTRLFPRDRSSASGDCAWDALGAAWHFSQGLIPRATGTADRSRGCIPFQRLIHSPRYCSRLLSGRCPRRSGCPEHRTAACAAAPRSPPRRAPIAAWRILSAFSAPSVGARRPLARARTCPLLLRGTALLASPSPPRLAWRRAACACARAPQMRLRAGCAGGGVARARARAAGL